MKTKFLLPLLLLIAACQDSDLQVSRLPDTLLGFKGSDKVQLLEAAHPGYLTRLEYEHYWMETLNGEQVYAVPARNGDQTSGILYVSNDLRALFSVLEFKNEVASCVFTNLSINASVKFSGYKVDSHLYRFDVDEIEVKSFSARAQETYTTCVTRVYQTAKKACEANATCDTLCDNIASCHGSMLAAAAWTCL